MSILDLDGVSVPGTGVAALSVVGNPEATVGHRTDIADGTPSVGDVLQVIAGPRLGWAAPPAAGASFAGLADGMVKSVSETPAHAVGGLDYLRRSDQKYLNALTGGYGITGLNVADDTAAIQALIDSFTVGSPGEIYFPTPPVGYRMGDVILRRPIRIVGDGCELSNAGTNFRLKTVTSHGFIIQSTYHSSGIGAPGCALEGLSFRNIDNISDWVSGQSIPIGVFVKPSPAYRAVLSHKTEDQVSCFYEREIAGAVNGASEPDWAVHQIPGEHWIDGDGGHWVTRRQHAILSYARVSFKDLLIEQIHGDGIFIYGDPSGLSIGQAAVGFAETEANLFKVGYANSEANLVHAERVKIDSSQGNGLRVTGGSANAGHFERLDLTANNGWGLRDVSDLGNNYVACHTRDNAGGPFMLTNPNGTGKLDNCYSEGGQADGSRITGGSIVIVGTHYAGFDATTYSYGCLLLGSSGSMDSPLNVRSRISARSSILTLNRAYSGADPGSVAVWGQQDDGRGFVEAWTLGLDQLGSSDYRGLYAMVDGPLASASWGWNGMGHVVSQRFFAPKGVQLGDFSDSPARVSTQAATLTDGHHRFAGDVYLYTGAAAALSAYTGRKCVRAGRAAKSWTAGEVVAQGAIRTDSNGNIQSCVVAGTCGGAEPGGWSSTKGTNTTDNTVTWKCGAITSAFVTVPAYPTSVDIADFLHVYDSGTGYIFEATRVSGVFTVLHTSGSAPGWDASKIGAITSDGNIRWRCKWHAVQAARWEEFGVGAGVYIR